MSYIAQTFAVTTSSTLVVAADADVDRMVHLSPDNSTVKVGFTNSDEVLIRQGTGGTPFQITSFVLPAGKDIYLSTTSGTANCGVITTKIIE